MGDLYNELVKFMEDTTLKDSVEMQFVDLMEDGLTGHDYAKETLDKGYQLPITFINDQPVYTGGIDNRKVFLALKKFL
ncbi:hypothetical protein SAMN05446037_1002277 [Anaerovirgula multivorans]|uniref:Thioredoxin domain-containing protein n=1 Tax=Anaerovirgula multivorans TaxID=312168 RepID=A0A239AUH7_9FIRM|nr:hypothetical protein [Anaerovirgula multivorans]SNR99356.1 hypothetical protein SAMN05446037_1002277 [Anaerovirgula multivorans]